MQQFNQLRNIKKVFFSSECNFKSLLDVYRNNVCSNKDEKHLIKGYLQNGRFEHIKHGNTINNNNQRRIFFTAPYRYVKYEKYVLFRSI